MKTFSGFRLCFEDSRWTKMGNSSEILQVSIALHEMKMKKKKTFLITFHSLNLAINPKESL